jgi:cobalt-zinc-cadmium efflux system outer membrane protein
VFDRAQARIARLEARIRQNEQRVNDLALSIRADVRAARARVVGAREVALRYQRDVVPLREKIVRLSQQQYDAMLLGTYQLLQAKQAEVTAWVGALDGVRDAWSAWFELERLSGGRVQEAK